MNPDRLPTAPCPAPAEADAAVVPGVASPRRRRLALAASGSILATFAALAAGCSLFAPPPPPPPPPPEPPPPPPRLVLRFVASKKVNPDARSRPSPVVVRLYELKSEAQFNAADFMSLNDQDKTALADDIVAREEFVLQPGETKLVDGLLSPETRAVGVMAAFRDLERARWRSVATTKPGRDNRFDFQLDDVFVSVSAAGP